VEIQKVNFMFTTMNTSKAENLGNMTSTSYRFCVKTVTKIGIAGFTGLNYHALLKVLDAEDCTYIKYRYEAGKKIRDQFEY